MARPSKEKQLPDDAAAKKKRGWELALSKSLDGKRDVDRENPPQWRDMTNLDLKGKDMVEFLRDSGQYRNIDFSGSDLSGAFFQYEMTTAGVPFRGNQKEREKEKLIPAAAMLHGCKFNNCILTDTDFSGCDLRWSDFQGSNYQEAIVIDEELGFTANIRECRGVSV